MIVKSLGRTAPLFSPLSFFLFPLVPAACSCTGFPQPASPSEKGHGDCGIPFPRSGFLRQHRGTRPSHPFTPHFSIRLTPSFPGNAEFPRPPPFSTRYRHFFCLAFFLWKYTVIISFCVLVAPSCFFSNRLLKPALRHPQSFYHRGLPQPFGVSCEFLPPPDKITPPTKTCLPCRNPLPRWSFCL